LEKFWKPTKTTPTTKKPKEKTTNNKQTTNSAYHTVKHSKPHDTPIFPHFNQQPNKHAHTNLFFKQKSAKHPNPTHQQPTQFHQQKHKQQSNKGDITNV
jgi:hypothetical protein